MELAVLKNNRPSLLAENWWKDEWQVVDKKESS